MPAEKPTFRLAKLGKLRTRGVELEGGARFNPAFNLSGGEITAASFASTICQSTLLPKVMEHAVVGAEIGLQQRRGHADHLAVDRVDRGGGKQ